MQGRTKKFFGQLTPTQFIVLGYFGAVSIATILLLLPISLKPGVQLSFVDALFTATSGVTVTGLTAVNTAETFSVFGSLVLILLFQIGGIGIMTLGTFLWMVLGKSINLSYRKLIMIDQNRHNLSGLVQLMRIVLMLALIIEAIGVIIFGTYFYFAGYYDRWYEAFYYGFFHGISSYTNAGFDIFGNSLQDFSGDYFVQTITMALVILGAIGFPVLIEVREYFFGKHKKFRFSLFTKVTTSMFFSLLFLGTAGIWLIEKSMYYAGMVWHEKLFFSLFNSVTVRSGGFATMDVSQYDNSTQFLLSTLMFIGASPSSVGGGVRTTTLAIILLALVTYAFGKNEVRIFARSVKQEDITKSFVVFTAGIVMVILSIITLDVMEGQNFSLTAIIFEVTSAFGTCGLSTGITGDLTDSGKGILMVLMFVGRIGILSLLFIFRTKKRQEKYHYPQEEIIIG
jgi:potassium uptake TrkH family protein